MKRSKNINLERMRKTKPLKFKPIAAAVATALLVSCGNNTREAQIYTSVEDCKVKNPSLIQECEQAYQSALQESANSGPKYSSERNCEAEFGNHNCVPYRAPTGNNWFMPALAGFMFAQMLDRNRDYYYYNSSPVYTSYSRHSPFYGRWTTVDGNMYGSVSRRTVRVDNDAFKPKPKVTKTISRGGFGSKVAAKSSWGGSTRSGWGG